ncbi:GNAT family N-acetyltransferase [Amycolatopsis azurea]|uniref:GNAT family N-acetyltransferase n=1 Tax=Amycolatopsis azurea TaxID=36819 RepID=UPI0038261DEF
MSDKASKLLLHRHDAREMQQLRDELLSVYAVVYADVLADPFFSAPRFWERLENYARGPGFSLVTGRLEGKLVGYSLGYRLPNESGWWRGFRGETDMTALSENGERTFAVTQLMVLPDWQRRGYAKQLHDELLSNRTEERATLLVRPDNVPARTAYLKWGWQQFGQVKPFSDSPVYDSLMLPLSTRA